MSIFISYRRGPTQAVVQLIKDHLERHFSDVFFDVHSIDGGDPFGSRITGALERADVVLVVIGKDWLRDGSLNSPEDWVRREVELSLARTDVVVIPVLVGGARLPEAAELPESLEPLLTRQALRLDTGVDFDDHIKRLIRSIRPHIPTPPWRRHSVLAALGVGLLAVLGVALAKMTGPGDSAPSAEPPASEPTDPEPAPTDSPSTPLETSTSGETPAETTGAPAKPTIPSPPPDCIPGEKKSEECGNCGTKVKTCSRAGTWGPFGPCGQGECRPGQKRATSCGNCGQQRQVCSSTCNWKDQGTCTGQGECKPGDKKKCGRVHSSCTQGTETCSSECRWSSCVGASCTSFSVSTNDTMHPCGPNMLHPSNCGYDIRATCPTGSVATGECSVNHPSALGECSVSATKSGQTTSAHLQMKIGRNKRIECSVPQCKCVYQL